MRQLNLQIPIEVYDSLLEMSDLEQDLLRAAKTGLQHAYAPYSGFQVSAALLVENGALIVGANQENAAYPMCLCAERVALGAAHAQYPGLSIKKMAITVRHQQKPVTRPAAPCGACRQVLCETEFRFGSPIELILQGETGEIFKFHSAKDLLPLSFDGSFL